MQALKAGVNHWRWEANGISQEGNFKMAEIAKENLARILLAGNISSAFLDSRAAERLECALCDNISDAADEAKKSDFRLIGVVMPPGSVGLTAALGSLRQACGNSKIILLAQMYQEPVAIKLTGPDWANTKLADDYLICPVVAADFYKFVQKDVTETSDDTAQAVAEDAKTAARIKELERLATEDDLTSLKNRRYIWEFARQIIEHAKAQDGQVTLLIFDIDDFKHYNDKYGHPAGDEILKQAASLMKRCCRTHDVVGRIGGDEFAVVFWDDPQRKYDQGTAERRSAAQHPREGLFIAERFREQMEKTDFDLLGPDGKGILTISGGLASFPHDGSNAQELFKNADTALLEAKRSGKNRVYLVGGPNAH